MAEDEQKVENKNTRYNGPQLVYGRSLTAVLADPRNARKKSTLYFPKPTVAPTSDIDVASFTSYFDSIRKQLERGRRLRRKDSERTRTRAENTEVYKVVPNLFFSSTFDLSDPQTFRVVYQEPTAAAGRKISNLIQEKLCVYLDLIELKLVNAISSRSTAVFSALLTLESLDGEVSGTLKRIEGIKRDLATVHETQVQQPLNVIKLRNKRRNLEILASKLSTIRRVQNCYKSALEAMEKELYVVALEYVEQALELFSSRLQGVSSLGPLKNKLKNCFMELQDKLKEKFLAVVVMEEPTLSDVSTLAYNLATRDILQDVIEKYREILYGQIKQEARLPFEDDSDERKIEDRIRAMDVATFGAALTTATDTLLKILTKARTFKTVLEAIWEMPAFAGQEETESQKRADLLINTLVVDLSENAQFRINKIILLRKQIHRRLTLEHFTNLVEKVDTFIKQVVAISQKSSVALRPTLIKQAKLYLQTFHKHKMEKACGVLDNEDWNQSMIIPEIRNIIHSLSRKPSTKEAGEDSMDVIYLGDERFVLVNSALMFCVILDEYRTFLEHIPFLVGDYIQRIGEILTIYNQRTCALVLGQGMREKRSVRAVTAKNLALATQALDLIAKTLPAISAHARPFLPEHDADEIHPMLQDLERIKQDYVKHKNEIFLSIVAIMRDRLNKEFKDFRVYTQSPPPSKPFQVLAHKTGLLHNIIAPVLSIDKMRHVFGMVIEMYHNTLMEVFGRLHLNQEQKARLVEDVMYFRKELAKLSSLEDPGEDLEQFVKKM